MSNTSTETPDIIFEHTPEECIDCGCSLKHAKGIASKKRQVFDIPLPKIEVTEHRSITKICPNYSSASQGTFPSNIQASVQYGEVVQTLSAYFIHQQLISYDRVSQIFEDVFGIKLSKGTCVNVDQKLFKQLEPFENNLKRHLIESAILHFDETGIRCEKANHWIHTTASTQATFYSIHRERGKNALNRINILPRFNNIAAHDHWNPYFAYDVKHSLCNAHHLRELTFIHESHEEEWALKMKKFLIKAKNIVEEHCYFDYLPIAQ